jgi:hypothetical protein
MKTFKITFKGTIKVKADFEEQALDQAYTRFTENPFGYMELEE